MEVNIKTIPHSEQRYKTVGDYWTEGDVLNIRVSEMGNREEEFLVALHELIESHLVLKRGISIESIDEFDKKYEALRPEGDVSEPGNSVGAPYFKEHQFATCIEWLMAIELGIDWNVHDKHVNSL